MKYRMTLGMLAVRWLAYSSQAAFLVLRNIILVE